MFEYIKLPFMAEDTGASTGSESSTGNEAGSQETNNETTQTGVINGEAVPDGSKPSAAWAEMRRKAQEADTYKTKIDTYEKKLERLNKCIPDGYSSLDEYLDAYESEIPSPETYNNTNQTVNNTTIDENKILETVLKKVEEMPVIKQTVKERQNRFLVESYTAVQKKFPDVKKPEDIPVEVWNAWEEGKSGRSLLSHLKEYRYDNDIENARKQGAGHAKAQAMGVAHTNQVQGTTDKNEYDNITVPDDVKNMMMRNKLLRKKIQEDPNYIKKQYATKHR
jgi:hypothetical protein